MEYDDYEENDGFLWNVVIYMHMILTSIYNSLGIETLFWFHPDCINDVLVPITSWWLY